MKVYVDDLYDRLGYLPPASIAHIDTKFPSKSTLKKFKTTYKNELKNIYTLNELDNKMMTDVRIGFPNKEVYLYGETMSLINYYDIMFRRFLEFFNKIKSMYNRELNYSFKIIRIHRQLIIEFTKETGEMYWISYFNIYETNFFNTIKYIFEYCEGNDIVIINLENFRTKDVVKTNKILKKYFTIIPEPYNNL
jgi:hypothetical protein